MITISWRANLGRARRIFGTVVGRAKNMTPVLRGPVETILHNTVRANFSSRGLLATPVWAPLTPAVAARPRIDMMRVSDKLFTSVTQSGGDNVAEISPDRRALKFGSRVSYFSAHQHGKPGLPQRQVIPDPLPKTAERQIREAMRDWVVRGTLDPVPETGA